MLLGEAVAGVRGEGGEVDRGLRVRGQDEQRVAGLQGGQREAGADERERAAETAGVEDVRGGP